MAYPEIKVSQLVQSTMKLSSDFVEKFVSKLAQWLKSLFQSKIAAKKGLQSCRRGATAKPRPP